ncbi:recombinase family protein [Streptomyces sp. NPDC102270]|uniref:recombinase family protein n=1 Tax=Streptomyces sp. NPDC102270 TaxID=3366150 RepID=UPI00382EA56C
MSYARTSEDDRQRDGHGVRFQLLINERTARDHGCVVIAEYSDNGRSASKEGTARPGFDRLIADLLRGRTDSGQRIKGVVCVADDRLYRRAEDLARFLAALTSSPGRIHLDQEGVRDPCSREGLMQAVRSLDAAVTETRIRSRRVSNWHWARAVEGVPHSGPRPFGWLEDRITLHAEEADLVARAIGERVVGKAVRAIARDWCELGITGTRGGRPNGQTVTQIITAPRVCGYRANRGQLLIAPETGAPVLGQWQPSCLPRTGRRCVPRSRPGASSCIEAAVPRGAPASPDRRPATSARAFCDAEHGGPTAHCAAAPCALRKGGANRAPMCTPVAAAGAAVSAGHCWTQPSKGCSSTKGQNTTDRPMTHGTAGSTTCLSMRSGRSWRRYSSTASSAPV